MFKYLIIVAICIVAVALIGGNLRPSLAIPTMNQAKAICDSLFLDDNVVLIVQNNQRWLVKKYKPRPFEIPLIYEKYKGKVIQVDEDWNKKFEYYAGSHQLITQK